MIPIDGQAEAGSAMAAGGTSRALGSASQPGLLWKLTDLFVAVVQVMLPPVSLLPPSSGQSRQAEDPVILWVQSSTGSWPGLLKGSTGSAETRSRLRNGVGTQRLPSGLFLGFLCQQRGCHARQPPGLL